MRPQTFKQPQKMKLTHLKDNSDDIIIPKKMLTDEFIGVMPEDLFILYLKTDSDHISINKSIYESMVAEKNKRAQQQNLISRTAMLNNKGIELEKSNDIDGAIEVYEENIKLGAQASHSFDRLRILYRKRGDVLNEKRVLSRRYEVYNLSSEELKKELERIDIKVVGIRPKPKLPQKANPSKPLSTPPLGIQYQKTITLLPEFNFYYDKPDEESTNSYLFRHPILVNDKLYKPILWQIQRKFKELLETAKKFEADDDLASSSDIYEKIIAEQYYQTEPYDKLQRIYFKAHLVDDSIRILSNAIEFFSLLREQQKIYVLKLAEKYGKLEYAHQMINENKKIFYYGGAFELYNPFTITLTWEQKISKLKID
jgi:hypothetical protein